MSSTVKSIAYVQTADMDPTVVKSGATWEGLANITAAEKALVDTRSIWSFASRETPDIGALPNCWRAQNTTRNRTVSKVSI